MKYQLVLQWPASSIEDYDALVEMESLLESQLSGNSDVDGHDAGSGEMNIFIHTDLPEQTFEDVKGLLRNHKYWPAVRAAYRDLKGARYTTLWPKDLTEFKVT